MALPVNRKLQDYGVKEIIWSTASRFHPLVSLLFGEEVKAIPFPARLRTWQELKAQVVSLEGLVERPYGKEMQHPFIAYFRRALRIEPDFEFRYRAEELLPSESRERIIRAGQTLWTEITPQARRGLRRIVLAPAASSAGRVVPLFNSFCQLPQLLEVGNPVILLPDWAPSPPPGIIFPVLQGLKPEEWFGLIACADLVVSPDSGAVHVASLFHRPLLTAFGPHPPQVRLAFYDNRKAIMSLSDEMRLPSCPCYLHAPACPLTGGQCLYLSALPSNPLDLLPVLLNLLQDAGAPCPLCGRMVKFCGFSFRRTEFVAFYECEDCSLLFSGGGQRFKQGLLPPELSGQALLSNIELRELLELLPEDREKPILVYFLPEVAARLSAAGHSIIYRAPGESVLPLPTALKAVVLPLERMSLAHIGAIFDFSKEQGASVIARLERPYDELAKAENISSQELDPERKTALFSVHALSVLGKRFGYTVEQIGSYWFFFAPAATKQ